MKTLAIGKVNNKSVKDIFITIASFLFVGDLNVHHQELFGSTTTIRHGVAAFAFAAMSSSDQ